MAKRWTEEEKKTLRYLLGFPNKYSYLDLSEVLERPLSGVRKACNDLNLQDNVRKIKSQGEEILFDFLREIYPNIIIKKQHPIGERLFLDVYIPELSLGFEYDGIQHSQACAFFHKNHDFFLRGQILDDKKDNICATKGINLIRIGYENVLSKDFILNEIEKIGPGKENVTDEDKNIKQMQKEYNKEKYKKFKDNQNKSEYKKLIKKKNQELRKELYSQLKSMKKEYGN